MSDFQKFRDALKLLAECSEGQSDFAGLATALLAKRGNRFHHFDFDVYASSLFNTITGGLEQAMDRVSPEDGHE